MLAEDAGAAFAFGATDGFGTVLLQAGLATAADFVVSSVAADALFGTDLPDEAFGMALATGFEAPAEPPLPDDMRSRV